MDDKEQKLKRIHLQGMCRDISERANELYRAFDTVLFVLPKENKPMSEIRKEAEEKIRKLEGQHD